MFGGLQIRTPSFTMKPKRIFVGIDRMMSVDQVETIPAQWAAFNASDGVVENRVGQVSYGIAHGFLPDNTWRYACAYEVKTAGALHDGYAEIRVPSGHFAVFKSSEHIAQIGEVIGAVMSWIETSDYAAGDGPTIEVYGPSYDPQTGAGGFEILTPVKPADD